MNKLEELSIIKSREYATVIDATENTSDNFNTAMSGYKSGFDAVIALNLPVKFAEWLWKNVDESQMSTTTWEELYKEWIENFYSIEL